MATAPPTQPAEFRRIYVGGQADEESQVFMHVPAKAFAVPADPVTDEVVVQSHHASSRPSEIDHKRIHFSQGCSEADRTMDLDRLLVADGLRLVGLSEHITRRTMDRIAVWRALLFCALVATNVFLCLWLALVPGPVLELSGRMTSAWEQYPGSLTLSVCDGTMLANATFGGAAAKANVVDELTSSNHHRIIFRPRGHHVAGSGMAQLHYFTHEEYAQPTFFGSVDELYPALSFGVFQTRPLVFDVDIEGPANCNGANGHFASAVSHVMREAANPGLRVPRALDGTGGISSYGALLLKMDPDHPTDTSQAVVWQHRSGSFGEAYAQSQALLTQRCVQLVLTILLAITTFVMLGNRLHTEWMEAVDDWVIMYDWLWDNPAVRRIATKVSARQDQAKLVLSPRAWRSEGMHPVELFSLVFLLDNVIGNSQRNMESWLWGTLSALGTAQCVSLFLVLPVLAAVFLPGLRTVLACFAILHGCTASLYATSYYCAWRRGRIFLWGAYRVVSGALLLFTHGFLNMSFIFLLTRTIVEAKRSVTIIVPTVTIILFCMVMYNRLILLQRGYIKDAKLKAGKGRKGLINKVLTETQMTSVGIVLFVIFAGVILVFYWLLLMLLLIMSSDRGKASDVEIKEIFGTVGVPLAAVTTAVGKIKAARRTIDDYNANMGHVE